MLQKLMLALIRFYQRCISPYTQPHCRFTPTCSAYAFTAISRYGPFQGGWLAICRIMKCHPFHEGGYDPVPEPEELAARRKRRRGR